VSGSGGDGVWSGWVVESEEDGVELKGGLAVCQTDGGVDDASVAWGLDVDGANPIWPTIWRELAGESWHYFFSYSLEAETVDHLDHLWMVACERM
jgi:hypothetical protein